MLEEQPQALEQEIAEVAGVELLQAALIGGIELRAFAGGECIRLAGRHVFRRQPAVLPAVDEARELTGRPAILVEALRLDHLLHQADLVVVVEDCETRTSGRRARHAGARILTPIEWNVPSHGMPSTTPPTSAPMRSLHLARGLVGERNGENLARVGPAGSRGCGRCASSGREFLPVPAPANTSTGPSSASTASRCSGLSPPMYGGAPAVSSARAEIGCEGVAAGAVGRSNGGSSWLSAFAKCFRLCTMLGNYNTRSNAATSGGCSPTPDMGVRLRVCSP